MTNPLSLGGRRFLVTGAASGIGRAAAIMISELSGWVVGVDIDAEGLEGTLADLSGEGHTCHERDLRDLAGIPLWMETLSESSGPLHGVVHAAGLPCTVPLRALDPASYRDPLTVNAEAGLALARSFLNRRVYFGEHGAIVFVASVMAIVGSPAAAGYSMTKGAVVGMTRSMALELAPKGIRVNCVAPGFVRTPMYDKAARLWSPEQKAELQSRHPLGLGEPEDVASAIAFLLADTAKWITGTVLTVDGGYTAQ